jgi:hypothetical protein
VDTVHCLKKVSVYIFVPYDISSVGPNPIFWWLSLHWQIYLLIFSL